MDMSVRKCQLDGRGFIEIRGIDAWKFLQGLITNQLNQLKNGDGIFAAFLNAQGRVLFDGFIYQQSTYDDSRSYVVDVDIEAVGPLLQHMRRFVLRSKVQLTDCTTQYRAIQAWGSGSEALSRRSLPTGMGCRDPRHKKLGMRFVLNNDAPFYVPDGLSVTEESFTAYKIRRMLLAIPEGTKDFFAGTSLPLESNLDLMNAIDFRKGCYLGQELTARTYHTGVTRKRIVPVQLYPLDSEPPAEMKVDLKFNEELPASASDIAEPTQSPSPSSSALRKREAGWFCSGVHNVGLALMRLDHIGLPMVTSNGLGIKAFLPSSLSDKPTQS